MKPKLEAANKAAKAARERERKEEQRSLSPQWQFESGNIFGAGGP